jgi:hypothetical protein
MMKPCFLLDLSEISELTPQSNSNIAMLTFDIRGMSVLFKNGTTFLARFSGTIWDLRLIFPVRKIWLFKRPRRPLYVARFLRHLIDYICSRE